MVKAAPVVPAVELPVVATVKSLGLAEVMPLPRYRLYADWSNVARVPPFTLSCRFWASFVPSTAAAPKLLPPWTNGKVLAFVSQVVSLPVATSRQTACEPAATPLSEPICTVPYNDVVVVVPPILIVCAAPVEVAMLTVVVLAVVPIAPMLTVLLLALVP